MSAGVSSASSTSSSSSPSDDPLAPRDEKVWITCSASIVFASKSVGRGLLPRVAGENKVCSSGVPSGLSCSIESSTTCSSGIVGGAFDTSAARLES